MLRPARSGQSSAAVHKVGVRFTRGVPRKRASPSTAMKGVAQIVCYAKELNSPWNRGGLRMSELPLLSDVECRVLGALIEKDITTPDYYPLSLNALVNACNQKNNRDPVMSLDENTVRDSLYSLQEKRLAGPASGADSRVTKYEHRIQEVFNFTRAETA